MNAHPSKMQRGIGHDHGFGDAQPTAHFSKRPHN